MTEHRDKAAEKPPIAIAADDSRIKARKEEAQQELNKRRRAELEGAGWITESALAQFAMPKLGRSFVQALKFVKELIWDAISGDSDFYLKNREKVGKPVYVSPFVAAHVKNKVEEESRKPKV